MRTLLYSLIALTMVFGLGCGEDARTGRGAGEVETSPQTATQFKVETVVGGLEVPWSIVWAPDGRMIFTERPGRVRVFEKGALRQTPLFVVQDVEQTGETGLMSGISATDWSWRCHET